MIRYVIMCCILALAMPVQAWAQAGGLFGGEEGGLFETVEEPAAELPALPKMPDEDIPNTMLPTRQDQGYAMEFPELPPSRLCRKGDILGMWKLAMVFEVPAGSELDDFGLYPYQYMLFNDDNTFRMYKSAREELSDAGVLREMKNASSKVLEQFVVHESGVLYLYKDGVAVDSLACFVVADPLNPFAEGQILFMPPPEEATIRMVKAYNQVYSAPQKKKKKKRRRRRR